MRDIIMSIVRMGVRLVMGPEFMALEVASTEPSGVSRRKEKDKRTD